MNFLIPKKQVQFASLGKRFAGEPRDVRNLIPPFGCRRRSTALHR